MKFRLIYQGNDVRLGLGDHLVGRSPDCSLCLDDPLVSRHHGLLQVGEEVVTIQDLGSRNGIAVNGARVHGSQTLLPGDQLTVGGTDLVLVTGTNPRANSTTAREQTADAKEMLALLGRLATKALALGNAVEAERILRHHLENLLSRVLQGQRPDGELLDQAIGYASQLACETNGGRWLSYVFELCIAAETYAPEQAVEQLYANARRMQSRQLRALGDYIALHRAHQASMTPHQRFVLSRAEGLLRSLQV